jgi:hypothetical protein
MAKILYRFRIAGYPRVIISRVHASRLQYGRQKPSGQRLLIGGNLVRRTDRHNMASSASSLRAQVNDPVRRLDHIQIVLNDQNRSAGFNQRLNAVRSLLMSSK